MFRSYNLPEGNYTLYKLNNIAYGLNKEERIAKVVGEESADGKIIIPRSITYQDVEHNVISIEKNAFRGDEDLQSIQFAPDSLVATIGKNAFDQTSIESINFPSSIIELESGWGKGLHQLREITIDPNNRKYKMYADKFIIGKTSIDQDDYDTLVYCVKCKNAVIPDFIETIGSYCFSNCYKIKIEFTENSKLRKIERGAFSTCALESIKIPSSCTIICEESFRYCEDLREIEIPENSELHTIEKNAFLFCNIESLSIPEKLVNLNDGWSSWALKLNSINVSPKNPRYKTDNEKKFIFGKSSIEQENFDVLVFCVRDAEKVTIPDFVEIIGPNCFSECKMLSTVETSDNSKLRIIEYSAFSGSNIESISIPPHLTKIGDVAFSSCSSLLRVEIPADSDLQIIGKRAFARTNIQKFTFPRHITEINEGTFTSCNSLQKVEFPDDSKIERIDEWAFNDSGIQTIKIPSNVTVICKMAFGNCKQLRTIEIDEDSKLQTIEKNAFYSSALENFTFPANLTNLKDEWLCGELKLKEIKISPKNPRYKTDDEKKFIFGKSSMEQEKFDVLVFCVRNVEKVTIPDFVEIIGSLSFSDCKQLRSVEFSNNSNLRIIEKSAFSDLLFDSIYLPPHLTKICKEAFKFCRNLKRVEIPSNSELQIIENDSFSYTEIESISIPSSVVQICKHSFCGCRNLKRIEIAPNSQLRVIENLDFDSTKISSFIVPPHVEDLNMSIFYKCRYFKIIEVEENSQLKKIIDKPLFQYYESELLIMIPPELRNNFTYIR
ncbi:hypothetical protein M9Y10_028831 [Tritrichomonas musculus]|uniref:Surface antigen BspA-like n=1 Tax=Tritrichomonas musculus TaxID=1915356 RepID=A0ABR2KLA6_9EUKA